MTTIRMAGVFAAALWLASTSAHASPFIGQILTTGENFCPVGWAEMNGQLLPISEYDTLFSLIGTTFGGNGQTTFALPTAVPQFTATNIPLRQCISLTGIFPSRS